MAKTENTYDWMKDMSNEDYNYMTDNITDENIMDRICWVEIVNNVVCTQTAKVINTKERKKAESTYGDVLIHFVDNEVLTRKDFVKMTDEIDKRIGE